MSLVHIGTHPGPFQLQYVGRDVIIDTMLRYSASVHVNVYIYIYMHVQLYIYTYTHIIEQKWNHHISNSCGPYSKSHIEASSLRPSLANCLHGGLRQGLRDGSRDSVSYVIVYTILYYTILHYTVFYYIILYATILYCFLQYIMDRPCSQTQTRAPHTLRTNDP